MKICVHAEPLAAVATSANHSRGMLRRLLSIRPVDRFCFFVRRGSESSPLLDGLLDGGAAGRSRLSVDRMSRRAASMLALVGLDRLAAARERADLFLGTDIDWLGPRARPWAALLADLSFLRAPASCGLPWYGVAIRRRALERCRRLADHIVTISEFTRRDLLNYAPELEARVSIIYPGIDDEWFEDAPEPPAEGRPYWIWHGYITKRKNLAGLLNGYARFIKREKDAPSLLIVSAAEGGWKDLSMRVGALGLESRVRRAGFLSRRELIDAVRRSAGLVFPSFYEGFGLPVIEAMALGKPALISDRGALPEVAGGLGVACDPGDPEAIADALARLLGSGAGSPEVVARRKARAARFTHEAAARAYSALIDRMTS